MRRAPLVLLSLVLAGTLAGCADDEPRPAADPTPTATAESSAAEPSGTPSPEPSATASSTDAGDAPLDWEEVPGPADTTVTVSGEWTLTQRATEAVLDGPRGTTVTAPRRHRVTETLIDGEYAVVVTEDEQAQQPNTATVIDLATGEEAVLDGRSDVPTTTGGTWALGDGTLAHATVGDGRRYCLATVELASMSSTTQWCAPPRNGFNGAQVTSEGVALLAFDDQRPSCRTVGEVDDEELQPFAGVPECTGWDAALLDDGAVWSVVPKERRIEEAHFFARSGDGQVDLGPGTSGSLTVCGGSAYFVRDPQSSGAPAQLMSWSPGAGLGVAYETEARGQAFLTEPRCGGSDLTLAALTQQGDTQLTARVR